MSVATPTADLNEAYGSLSPPGEGDLLAALLAEQSDLSAVERFSQRHSDTPLQARYYRTLLPTTVPGPGQQYGFEVDLDRCSGCKACVTACHNLNGLDEGEAWREVGLLHGGSASLPVLQHVTTACHHCLTPACAAACPVNAYEKDPATGIVKHLDDQCFGCQYCTLACPYDVPKFHKGKGIVRKCDMCSDRLAEGEAPACVQACPHEAIRIQIVDVAQVIEDCEANTFLPGAPNPDYTLPTTLFKTSRVLPRNLLPADYFAVHAEHAHWPLVIMLVLTQLSVGGFIAEALLRHGGEINAAGFLHPLFSLAWGLLALGASTLHLGRPHLAWRAFLGLGHSWLSREAITFGQFAPLAILYAGLTWWNPPFYADSSWMPGLLSALVAATGLLGVLCGVMVYHVVRREFWRGSRTVFRFFGTVALLGVSATLLTTAWSDAYAPNIERAGDATLLRNLAMGLFGVSVAKLLFEAATLLHLSDTHFSSLRRTAVLMVTVLRPVTAGRFILGLIGGVLLPTLLILDPNLTQTAWLAATTASFLLCLGGEIAERYLFFTAVVRQKMPGGLTV